MPLPDDDTPASPRSAPPTAWVGDPRSLSVIGMAAVLAAMTRAPPMAGETSRKKFRGPA